MFRSSGIQKPEATNKPVPIASSLASYLSNKDIAEDYDNFFKDTNLFNYDTTILDDWFPEPATLLDLGCGTGRHLTHFAKRNFSVTGIDLSSHMLNICREKIQREKIMARLIQGDIRNLSSFPEQSFTFALCMFSTLGMLRGAENRKLVLRELHRVLQPGGRFAFHTHNTFYDICNPAGMWSAFRTYTLAMQGVCDFGDKVFANYRGVKNMFLHTFSEWEIRELLRETGFQVLEFHYLNPQRNGPFKGRLPSFRSNGFLVHALKP